MSDFWASLKTMPAAEVASIVRTVEAGEQFAIMQTAIADTTDERVAEFRELFTPDERCRIVKGQL